MWFCRNFHHWLQRKLSLTTSAAASDENFVKMTTMPFGDWSLHWLREVINTKGRYRGCVVVKSAVAGIRQGLSLTPMSPLYAWRPPHLPARFSMLSGRHRLPRSDGRMREALRCKVSSVDIRNLSGVRVARRKIHGARCWEFRVVQPGS